MSWLSKYVFDPIEAAIARAASSSNPVVAAAAKQTAVSVATLNSQASAAAQSSGLTTNSAVGLSNTLVGDFENGLKDVVDAATIALIPGPIGVEASKLADVTLDFLEQHAVTYIASLFGHVRSQSSAPAAPAAPPQ